MIWGEYMDTNYQNGWPVELVDPIQGRLEKPRANGLTMVLDKGLGTRAFKDLVEIGGDYIDFVKFSFGTSLIYPGNVLKEKIALAREWGLDVYPGGTLFEVAISQNRLNEFLFRAKQIGFTAVEISNGTLNLAAKVRTEAIFKAHALGFRVLTEVGKKDRSHALSLEEMKEQILKDLTDGADKIIIEGRESGRGISIYHEDGSIDLPMVEGILAAVEGNEEIIIWEAPLKKQQVVLIKELGPNVNLGNIAVNEVIALETLRRGLRGDTFIFALSDTKTDKVSNAI